MEIAGFETLPRVLRFAFALVATVALLAGCTMDARITRGEASVSPPAFQGRSEADFISSETVVTSAGTPGYEIKGAFGEIPQRTHLPNGWKIEAVFYE